VGTGPLCLTFASCLVIASSPRSSAVTRVSIVVPLVRISLMYDNYLSHVIRAISAASPLLHVLPHARLIPNTSTSSIRISVYLRTPCVSLGYQVESLVFLDNST